MCDACMCFAERMPKYMCPEQKTGSGGLRYHSMPYSGSFTEPGVHAALDGQAASPSHPPVSTFLRAGVSDHFQLLPGCWDPNSKLHMCTANILKSASLSPALNIVTFW